MSEPAVPPGPRASTAGTPSRKLISGSHKEANASFLVLLVLRGRGWAIDRMTQAAGAESCGQLMHPREHRRPGRELLVAPIRLDQDDVCWNRLSRERPQRCSGYRRLPPPGRRCTNQGSCTPGERATPGTCVAPVGTWRMRRRRGTTPSMLRLPSRTRASCNQPTPAGWRFVQARICCRLGAGIGILNRSEGGHDVGKRAQR